MDEKAREEKEELKKERMLLYNERRAKQAKLRKLEQKMELVDIVSHQILKCEVRKAKCREGLSHWNDVFNENIKCACVVSSFNNIGAWADLVWFCAVCNTCCKSFPSGFDLSVIEPLYGLASFSA